MKKMNNKGFSLIELIIVIAIMAVLVAVIAPNLTSYLGSSKKKTDNSNADSIENIVNSQLQSYASDEKIKAVANTDGAMTAYTTVDEIVAAATTFTADATYDSEFETNVKNNIPTKYFDSSSSTLVTKQNDFTFWVFIKGTKTDGFTAEVKCADKNTDPFSADR